MNGKQGETMGFRRGRSCNSLPRHLPSSYSVPYGFKIDLDFVRFCDNYYENKDNQRPASRLRRVKRSHKKSYDTLLGLRREKADKQKAVSPPTQAPALFFPSGRDQTDNKLASDLENSLDQVMSDFEEALEKSREAPGASVAYLSDGPRYRPSARRYHSLPRPAALRSHREPVPDLARASSNSSLSDSSGAAGPPAPASDIAREMAETINSLQRLSRMEDGVDLRPARRSPEAARRPPETARRSPETAKRSPETIGRAAETARRAPETAGRTPDATRFSSETARRTLDGAGRLSETTGTVLETTYTITHQQDQMGSSAQRIRELEEQVKAIPMLKHKLSVLREEKRSMEQLARSRPRRDPTPEAASEGRDHPVSTSLRSRSLSPAAGVTSGSRRVQQDASTSCRVLTRDVGVYGGPPSRETTPPREAAVAPATRVLTRDVGVCGGPAAATPPRQPTALRSVGVLTDLSAAQAEPGRRRISLEAILSGRGGSRSVGVGTRAPRLAVGGMHVEEVAAAPAPLGRLQVEERPRPPPPPPPVGVERGSQTRPPPPPSVGVERGSQTRPPPPSPPPGVERGSQTRPPPSPPPGVARGSQTGPPPPPGVERGSQTRPPALASAATATEPAPATRHAGAATDLTLDQLEDAEKLRLQLDELLELQRASRASSETRDTFTQIKEYELGVNYVRGAFSFAKSASRGVQTDAAPAPALAPTRSAGAQTEAAPAAERRPSTRTFAAQVHPATAAVGVQCRCATESRGVEARPQRRDAAVSAEQRRHTRSVASATDPAPAPAASEQVGRRSPPRQDAATATPTPCVVSRSVSTDKPKELLKKVKTTMTDVTPLRSVASGDHVISRHQSSQTVATSSPTGSPAGEPRPQVAPPGGRESPLPPLPRAAGSKIPRLATPPMARKAAPQVSVAPATPPAVRRSPTTAQAPTPTRTPASPPAVRRSPAPVPTPASAPAPAAAAAAAPVPARPTAGAAPSKEPAGAPQTPALPREPEPARRPAAAEPPAAEPKQRQFGRRDTFVSRGSAAAARDERGQGDTPERKIAPLADADNFSSDEERISTEVVAKTASSRRKKAELSAELRAALKVLNDSVTSAGGRTPSSAVTAAAALVQAEWFAVAGTRHADPLVVEDYLDALEAFSPQLLRTVVNMADNNNNTAMHYAVSHGNFDVVSVLLDSKVADVQRQNNAGYTCIMLLSLAQISSDTHRQVVRRLFQNGDVNVRAKQHGQTALMLAVSHGRLDMVNLLLEAGADINIQDEDGSTSLMCASEHGHLDIVRLLLAHPECDTQLTDNDGCTALQVAMEAGHRDVGLLLYAHSNFSRGSSPYGSLRLKRGASRTSTPGGRASATPPRGTPTGTPALGRRSHSSLH